MCVCVCVCVLHRGLQWARCMYACLPLSSRARASLLHTHAPFKTHMPSNGVKKQKESVSAYCGKGSYATRARAHTHTHTHALQNSHAIQTKRDEKSVAAYCGKRHI